MRTLEQRRTIARAIGTAAINAARPATAVRDAIRMTREEISIGPWAAGLAAVDRILVVGAGKAAGMMAQAVEMALGDRVTGGLVVTKDEHAVPTSRVRVVEASHPIPDERGVRAADELLRLVSRLTERDLVIVLISGGGSALLVAPADGITLSDKQATTSALLACGATINEMNCVRKHLSRVKGGQLARACMPARVVSLILSDVIGDPLDVIASGPTVPDPTTFRDALAVLDRYGLRGTVPQAVLRRFDAGAAGAVPETPKPGDPTFERSITHLVGTNRLALDAAARLATQYDYSPRVLTSTLRGEAREVAKVIGSLAEAVGPHDGPTALILGGETTVTLSEHPGRGGRNQELALAFAREVAGRDDMVLLSVGTDGTDGPTDAAGALVDGRTCERANAAGFSVEKALDGHNSYPLLEATSDLVKTGPTGTNVMDVVVVLVG